MTNDQMLAYAAGYFDGEGCITYMKGDKEPGLRIAVVSSDQHSLEVFATLFGGRVVDEHRERNPNFKSHHKKIFGWRKNGRFAQEVLRQLIPLLVSKRDRAVSAVGRKIGVPGGGPRTACKRGHTFTTETIYMHSDGRRRCKLCRQRKYPPLTS